MNDPFEKHPLAPAQQPMQNHQKYCSACGEVILARAEICPNCGVRQMPPTWHEDSSQRGLQTQAPGGRNRIIAAILAILLGGLGAHRFYLGHIWLGIFYFLFSWTFIPGLIGLIEGILYLLMSDVDFDLKYNLKHLN